jgi:hypothetical protein
MNTSERFQRFAAECEVMAKFTPDPDNQLVWRRMAQRWTRCAELCERQDSLAHAAGPMMRRRQPAHNWVH